MSKCVAVDSVDEFKSPAWMPWVVCLSAGLFFFYVFFQLNAFDVINQSLRHDFQIDATQLSWMSSSFVWANVLFLLPAGIILDRFPARKVVLSAMFLCVFGSFGFALTHSFIWASFFHALTGASNAFCFLSCVILVTRWFSSAKQAFVMGCIVTLGFTGGMVAHTPLAYLDHTYGWRTALLMDGALGVLLWLWMLVVIKDKAHVVINVPDSFLVRFKKALMVRENLLCGLYTSCLNLPIMVLCALWGASYLATVHHISALDASRVVSFIYVGSILGAPGIGWLSDRYGSRKPFMVGCTLATLLVFVPIMMSLNVSVFALSGLFFFIGLFSSAQVLGYPLIASVNTPEQTGLATGVASLVVMGGGGIGQVLFGSLIQQHAGNLVRHYTISDFQYAMWMFPVALLVALIALLWTRERIE